MFVCFTFFFVKVFSACYSRILCLIKIILCLQCWDTVLLLRVALWPVVAKTLLNTCGSLPLIVILGPWEGNEKEVLPPPHTYWVGLGSWNQWANPLEGTTGFFFPLSMYAKSLTLSVQLAFLLPLGGKVSSLSSPASRADFTDFMDTGSFLLTFSWEGMQVPPPHTSCGLHPHSSVAAPLWWQPWPLLVITVSLLPHSFPVIWFFFLLLLSLPATSFSLAGFPVCVANSERPWSCSPAPGKGLQNLFSHFPNPLRPCLQFRMLASRGF